VVVEAAEGASEAVAMVVEVEETMAEAILEEEAIALAEETRLQGRALVIYLDQVLANLLLDLA